MAPARPQPQARAEPDVGVVIAAGGVGARAEGDDPKQFQPIAGVPMLLRAIRPFASHPRVADLVIALPQRFVDDPPPWLADVIGARLRVVPGGATRVESVGAALGALRAVVSIVLVHDAARPLVSRETIDAVIAVAAEGRAAVAGVPLTDTVKRARAGSRVVEATLARERLWRAQTPQGFPRRVLEEAYATWRARGGDAPPTDDAQLVEDAGHEVEIVPDRPTNIKVTTADDFGLAEALLR